jgi:nucleoid-associated protein YgaU
MKASPTGAEGPTTERRTPAVSYKGLEDEVEELKKEKELLKKKRVELPMATDDLPDMSELRKGTLAVKAEGQLEEFKAGAPEEKQAEPPQPPDKEPRIYVVKKGDSLSKIAEAVYGDANRWKEILRANKDQIEDARLIRPGQELRIP